MKFKGVAVPLPSKGLVINEPVQVVPNQSLSLKEILTRFVRHEALPVAHKAVYGSETGIDPESESPLNVDLEKLKNADFTEKAEYVQATKEVQAEYNRQEKAKADRARQVDEEKRKKDFEARVALEVEKRAKGGPDPKGSI